MNKSIRIALHSDDWIEDLGKKLVFNVSFKKLAFVLNEEIKKMAQDFSNPIRRLHASSVYSTITLLLYSLDEDISQELQEKPAAVTVKKVKAKRTINKDRKPKPSKAMLIQLMKDGVSQAEVAKLYGYGYSAVSRWYKDIRESGV